MGKLNRITLIVVALLSASCTDKNMSDAYGQFEAEEVTISAEVNGKILFLDVDEGDVLASGQQVALIDTMQIYLRKKELFASIKAIQTQIENLNSQAEVYHEQLQTAQKELNRLTSLRQQNAATQQQLDQASGQVNMLQKQIHSVEVQKQSVFAELEVMSAKIDQLNDQISRAKIINPMDGTVLVKFAELHELISQGRPLYSIAPLDQMILRVFVSGNQLPQITLGQEVDVLIDRNRDENEKLEGKISWISSQAEFTPKMIQTKEERVSQVYAMKVIVPNPEGKLKIGMPGEVRFLKNQ